MLFTSVTFVLYFLPAVLLLYYVCSFSRTIQNILLFLASLLFYAWGEPEFVLILMTSILLNTLFGWLVDKYRVRVRLSRFFLVLSCVMNVGLLFFFKYLNFVWENISGLVGNDYNMKKIILPLGISFFTFQAMSYVVDVYRGTSKVEKNPFYVGLYIAFFPQLIAGPIVRYNSIAEQIRTRRSDCTKFSLGCCRFVMGFGKKILLANVFAIMADHAFQMSQTQQVPAMLSWLGIIAYALQLFFDFSSYSDMAIGLALMFGFELEENFRYPFISKSVGEFWRRWHISLTTWFQEYVYFPLGGSRVSNKDKMIRNLFIVWFLTGIWHGANWTFLLWGILNFVFLLSERMFRWEESKVPPVIKHGYLIFAILMGFVLFRAENIGDALIYYKNLFGLNQNGFYSDVAVMFLKEYGIFLAAGILFSMPIAPKINRLLYDKKMSLIGNVMQAAYPVVMAVMFVCCMTYLVKGSYNPFIYFNF